MTWIQRSSDLWIPGYFSSLTTTPCTGLMASQIKGISSPLQMPLYNIDVLHCLIWLWRKSLMTGCKPHGVPDLRLNPHLKWISSKSTPPSPCTPTNMSPLFSALANPTQTSTATSFGYATHSTAKSPFVLTTQYGHPRTTQEVITEAHGKSVPPPPPPPCLANACVQRAQVFGPYYICTQFS